MKTRINALFALILVAALISLMLPHLNNGITGFAVIEPQQIILNQTFAESTTITLNSTNITSIRASGMTVEGMSKIYYQTDNGSLYTIIDVRGNSTFVDGCNDTCNLLPSQGSIVVLLRDNATITLDSLKITTQPLIGQVQNIMQLADINLTNSTTVNLSSYFVETSGAPLTYFVDVPTGVRSVLFDDVLFLSERDAGEFNATVTVSNGQMNLSNSFKIFVEQKTAPAVSSANFGILPLNQQFGISAQASIGSVVLNSTNGLNTITENLTAYPQNVVNGTEINYDWRLNGTSIAVLNLPMTAPFNNGTSNLTFDMSHVGSVGVMSGPTSPVWNSSGKYNGAYTFDGSGDNITFTQSTGNFSNTQPFSVEVWIYPVLDGTNRIIVGKIANSGLPSIGWHLRITTSNTARFILASTGSDYVASDTGVLTATGWQHIVGTWDGSTAKTYINGTLDTTTLTGGTLGNIVNTLNLALGEDGEGMNTYKGSLDEVRIYNRSLSAQEIAAIYNNSAPRYDRLVANETGGIGNNWSVMATPIDSLGLNGTGVLSNNVTIRNNSNLPPVVANVILNSTTGSNTTTENLTVFSTTSDPNNDNVTVNYDWRLNGTSIAVLNLPMTAPFNNGSRNLTFDFSSYNNTVILGSGTDGTTQPIWNATGKYGGSYQFDGSNDEISMPGGFTNTIKGDDTHSVLMWINARSLTNNPVLLDAVDAGVLGAFWELGDGAGGRMAWWGFGGAPNFRAYTGGGLATDTWYHLAFVKNGTGNNGNFYVNGALQTSYSGSLGSVPNVNSNFKIGRYQLASYEFNGAIDELQIYNRSLSAEEIFAIYNNSAPRYDRLVPNETGGAGNNWSVMATPIDSQGLNGTGVLSNNVTIQGNHAPNINSAILNSTRGTNTTSENLTVYINATDADGNNIQNIIDWRLNGTSIAVLNMPFETNIASTTSGAIRDYSQFGNNGTLGGGTAASAPIWNVSGRAGGAYTFDGVDDYVEVSDAANLRLTSKVTISAWIRPSTNGSTQAIVGKQSATGNWMSYMLRENSAQVFWYLDNQGAGTWVQWVSNPIISANNWHHVVGVWDRQSGTSSDGKIYFDGVEVATTFSNSGYGIGFNPGYSTLPLGIGRDQSGNFFNGSIDEVLVYNKSLSAAQVYQLYLDGNNSKHSSTIVSSELSIGQNWGVAVTPNDAIVDGATVLSNNVTILNSPPMVANVILNSTTGANLTTENLTVFSTTSDFDNGNVTVNYDWRLNGTSIALLNLPMTAPFNNGSRNLTFDFSSFNNVGEMSGITAPIWNASGKYGGAYSFTGIEYITIPQSNNFNTLTNRLSLEAWIYPTTEVADAYILTKSSGALSPPYFQWGITKHNNCGQKFEFSAGQGGNLKSVCASTNYAANKWYHVVMTYDGTNTIIYLNGTIDKNDSVTISGNLDTYATPVVIGALDTTSSAKFKGTVDEVRIYNRTLSPQEVSAIYNNTAPRYDRLVPQETGGIGNNWSVMATPIDSLGLNGTGVLSNNVTIQGNHAPNINSAILNSTRGTNTTTENLTVYINATDVDGNNIQNITDWRLNGNSIEVLNMPFETNISSTTSGAIRDYSQFGNNGTLGGGVAANAPIWNSSGKIGGAYSFDGVNDIINCGAMTVSIPVTYEAWINARTWPSANSIVNVYDGAFKRTGLESQGIADTLTVWFQDTIGNYVAWWATKPATNQWVHVVGVINGTGTGDGQIYYNGVSQSVSFHNGGTAATSTTAQCVIGALASTSYEFDGTIDEVHIYNRSLTAAQAYQLYLDGNASHHAQTMVSQELRVGQNWSVAVTPNDAITDGLTVWSNNVTIINLPPVINSAILNSTFGTNTTSENLTVYINATDADGNNIQNITDWRLNGASIAVLNMPFETNLSTTATGAIRDYSQFGNNGTLGGGVAANVPTWNASGKVGGAYSFDGVNDYISTTTFAASNNYTVEVWINPKTLPGDYPTIINNNNAGGSWDGFVMQVESATGKLYVGSSIPNRVITANNFIQTNQWIHLVYTQTPTGAALYKNGILNTTTGTVTNPIWSGNWIIGADSSFTSTRFFDGNIDEVKVYNRSLTAAQAYQLYLDGNASHHAQTIVSQELRVGQNWSVAVTPNDAIVDGATVLSNNVTIINAPPVITSAILNSTRGTNTTTENLTIYVTATDADGNNIQNITDWRLNGSSIAVLNTPFETNTSSTTSGAIRDYSQFGNNGTLGGGVAGSSPTWMSSGQVGGAYRFDGVDDFIDFGTYTFPDKLSISAWVNVTSVPNNDYVTIIASSAANALSATSFIVQNNSGVTTILYALDMDAGNRKYWNSSTFAFPTQMHHLVVTQDGPAATPVIYVDGINQTVTQTLNLGAPTHTAQQLTIGRYGAYAAAGLFKGMIDETVVFNKTLSAAQVYQLYLDGNNSKHASTILSQELVLGQNWSVAVTPNDAIVDGATVLSNNVTILAGLVATPSACGTVNGSLTLINNVSTAGGSCFDFNQTNVLFDCAGNNVTSTTGTGIAFNITTFKIGTSQFNLSNITIKNCNIFNFSIGINISSAVNISLFNNNITNVTDGIWLNNTVNSVIVNSFMNVSDGTAIFLTNSSNNTISANNVSNNNATAANRALNLFLSGNNLVMDNTVFSGTTDAILINTGFNNLLLRNFGSGRQMRVGFGRGILIVGGGNNTLINNTGTSDIQSGIELSGSQNNTLNNNTVAVFSNSGILLINYANNNFLQNNTIIQSTGVGIQVATNSTNNRIMNTQVVSSRVTGDLGTLYITTGSNNNTFTNNNITATAQKAITMLTSVNNTFINNTIRGVTGAIELRQGIQGTTFINNTITAVKTAVEINTSTLNTVLYNNTIINANIAIDANASDNLTIQNTTFINTNWSIQTNAGSNVSLIDNARITNYSFSNAPMIMIHNSQVGMVQFFNIVNANGTNLSMDVNLSGNKVQVNSSRSSGLNVSANITLFNVNYSTIKVAYDDINFANCPADVCSPITLSGGNTLFNVSHFTTFQASGRVVTACGTINESILLTQNILGTANTACFDFNQSNVVLDCAGYNITSNPQGLMGFNITTFITGTTKINLSNITIQNCNVMNFSVGINVSSAVNISLFNNNITNVTDGIWLNNTAGSVLENNTANATAGYGLYLANSSNNTINLGNFSANSGASSLYGIYLLSSNKNVLNNNIGITALRSAIYLTSNSNNNTLSNNRGTAGNNRGITVEASLSNSLINDTGTTNGDYGISFSSSSNNNLINNTGTASGQYGINLDTNSNNNILTNNIGTAGSVGIGFISSSNNSVTNNNGTSNNNYGIRFSSSSNNTVINNTAASGQYGIILDTNSNNNILINNTGTSANYSIYVTLSSNNGLTNNTFKAKSMAVYLDTSSNNNFTNNTLIGHTGFEINRSTGNIITNTSFQNTNWSIRTGLGSNLTLVDNERMTNYSFNNTPSLTITKTGIASVNFFNIINANGTNLSRDVNLTTMNRTFVNSANSPGLNVSANITVFNVTLTNPVILADFNDNGIFTQCIAPTCVNLSYAANAFTFNVVHFTTFGLNENLSIAGDAVLTVAKTDTPDPVTAGQPLNYIITVSNIGNKTAENVTVNETYPLGLTFVSASPNPSIGNNVWNLGSLANLSSTTINATLNVGNSLSGTISNLVNVTYNNVSGALIMTSATANTLVNPAPAAPVLAGSGGSPGPTIRQKNTSEVQQQDFGVSRPFIKKSIKKGEIITDEFIVTNTASVAQSFTLSVNKLSNLLHISAESFTLQPGERKTITVAIKADKKIPGDLYTGGIIIKGVTQQKEVLVVIDVAAQALFDIKVQLPQDPQKAKAGETINGKIIMFNMGDTEPIDVGLEYSLKDMDGNIITKAQETLAIVGQKQVNRAIKVPDKLAPGNYLFHAKIIYDGQTASSSALIEITQTQEKTIELPSAETITKTFAQNNLGKGLFNAGILLMVLFAVGTAGYLGKEHYKLQQTPFIKTQEFIIATKWAADKLKTNSEERVLLALLGVGLTREKIKLIIRGANALSSKKLQSGD